MNGFPKHKGAKAHVGNRRGSAVFQKQFASAFTKPGDPEKEGKVVTVGEDKWEDWQKGNTVKGDDGGTTRTDTRQGTRDTTTYTPPAEFDPDWYAGLTREQQIEADKRYREKNTKVTTEDLFDERTEETDPVEEAKGNLYGRGGTSNVRVHGSGSDVGYTGSMEYNPEQDYHMDQAISSYVPEVYNESGKYQGQGERVNFKDFDFYGEPEFQQLLTNLNFEMAVAGGGRDAMHGARGSEYGKALKAIASADDKQAAYERIKKDFPELVKEGDSAKGVNPLQNQGSGSFATSNQARDAASRGSGYKKRRTY